METGLLLSVLKRRRLITACPHLMSYTASEDECRQQHLSRPHVFSQGAPRRHHRGPGPPSTEQQLCPQDRNWGKEQSANKKRRHWTFLWPESLPDETVLQGMLGTEGALSLLWAAEPPHRLPALWFQTEIQEDLSELSNPGQCDSFSPNPTGKTACVLGFWGKVYIFLCCLFF